MSVCRHACRRGGPLTGQEDSHAHPQTPRRLRPRSRRRHPAARGRRVHRQAPRPGRRRRQGQRRRRRSRPRDPDRRARSPSRSSPTRTAEALDVLRHSSAHIMARAVMRLFPGAQLAFGPTIENGFYYDIDVADRRSARTTSRASRRRCARSSRTPSRSSASSGPPPRRAASCADLDAGLQGRAHRRRPEAVPDRSASTARASSSTCAAARTSRTPARSARSSCSASPGRTGRTTPAASSSSASTAPPSSPRRTSTPTCTSSKRRRSATTACSASSCKLFTISQLAGSGLILWMPQGRDRPRPAGDVHQGRTAQARLLSRSTRRTSAGSNCTAPAATSPTTATPSIPPMYVNPAGRPSTWPSTASPPGARRRREGDGDRQLHRAGPVPRARLRRGDDQPRKLEAVDATLDGARGDGRRAARLRQGDDAKRRPTALMDWLKDQEGYLLKPMNCPHHIQIYKAEPRSYRDLPVRLAEFGTVYRFEQTGELAGMTRVRGFTQDDAHLFVTPEQVEARVAAPTSTWCCSCCQSLGLTDYRVRVGLRDPSSDKYVGDRRGLGQGREDADRAWCKRRGMNYTAERGRGGVLRAEDRLRGPRLHRPRVAARHRAARLQPARALRAGVRRRGQHAAPAGDDPPRAVRLDGALHGHPDRALRRGVPAVAGPGAGARPADQRQVHRLRQEGRGAS